MPMHVRLCSDCAYAYACAFVFPMHVRLCSDCAYAYACAFVFPMHVRLCSDCAHAYACAFLFPTLAQHTILSCSGVFSSIVPLCDAFMWIVQILFNDVITDALIRNGRHVEAVQQNWYQGFSRELWSIHHMIHQEDKAEKFVPLSLCFERDPRALQLLATIFSSQDLSLTYSWPIVIKPRLLNKFIDS